MGIKGYIDITGSINCPHCGAEIGLDEWFCLWQMHWCPACLETITLEELQEAIDREIKNGESQ
jgi:hypothetical protein